MGGGGVTIYIYIRLYYIMLYYVILCYIMLYYVILCYIMLYYVTLCYIMLYYVSLCYIILYYILYTYACIHVHTHTLTLLHFCMSELPQSFGPEAIRRQIRTTFDPGWHPGMPACSPGTLRCLRLPYSLRNPKSHKLVSPKLPSTLNAPQTLKPRPRVH